MPRQLIVGLEGPWPTREEAAWLRHHQPGGVILFSRNIMEYSQLKELCAALRNLVPGLEVIVDHEGGAVSQAAAAVGRPPAAWGLGVLDDAGLTARVHEETARRLAAAGVDRVLAPVADVMTEPRNPVIGARAFGENATAVARQVVAAVTGLLSGGVSVCLKHWPGHGGSDRDTHRDPAAGDEGTGAPFAAGLEAGADAVMAGHLHVGGTTDAGVPLPATLDREALARARQSWGGSRAPLVVADDVTMGGLGEAMAGLGVDLPDRGANGMFEPADLPAAWFDNLAGAGCDRILVRGVPFGAFPVPGGTGQPLEIERDAQGTGGDPDFDESPYAEARRRLGHRALQGFIDPAREVAWLDLSSDDRWQAAAGASGRPEDVLDCLGTWFGGVRRVPAATTVPADCDRLVVSSHRPLDPGATRTLKVAENGVCLALGHPSLAGDLEDALGRKWRVGALFDVSAEDLQAGFPGPTKI